MNVKKAHIIFSVVHWYTRFMLSNQLSITNYSKTTGRDLSKALNLEIK